MRDRTLEVLRDPLLLDVRERHMARLEMLYSGQSLGDVFVLSGIQQYTTDPGEGWPGWLETSLDELAEAASAACDPIIFRPLAINYDPYGVHFVDQIFGAEVFQMGDGSWQARCLATPVGTLEPPDLEASETWARARAVAQRFVELNVPGVLFGLPTISSPLNIAVNLYGERILMAMMTEPEAAARDLHVITDVLCRLHRWYRGNVPQPLLQCVIPAGRCQPPGFGQLCGCSTQLLSAGLYRDFIAPLDAELLSVYTRGGMIHLCGVHTQHLRTWHEMTALRAVQLNDRAALDLAAYFSRLRDDQVIYVNPCERMPVERILQITGGERVVVVADLKEPPRVSSHEKK